MTPEQKQKLLARQKTFTGKLSTKQAEIMAKYKGPGANEPLRQKLLEMLKQALDDLGIVPGQPGADEKAKAFIESLDPKVLAIITGESAGEENPLAGILQNMNTNQPAANPEEVPSPLPQPMQQPGAESLANTPPPPQEEI